jgi:uncharacterized membrane protein YedE/YeeE
MMTFTPWSALAGGTLIGAAAVLLLWSTGRLAGISTIAARLLPWRPADSLWRAAFLLGLVAGAGLYYALSGAATPAPRPDFPPWLLAVAGLLVGFGTALANGCTSGHGVCGLARLSPRSLAATGVFLLAGLLTAYVVRHLAGVY